MAQFTWTFDQPTGTYKNHHISSKVYEAAVEEAVCVDYARPVPDFGRRKGDTVTLYRTARITEPTTAVLTEADRIPEDTFSVSTTSATVQELGRSVPFTSWADDLSKFDIENPIQSALKDQLKLVLDGLCATAMQAGQIKYAPTGLASNNITTNGTFGAAAAANLNTWHLEQIRDYLFDTLFAPPYESDDYVGIFRTLGLRGVKQDPAWEEWHKYTSPDAKYNNEIGKWENIRLVETNHNAAFAKVGTNSVLGEGVVFGKEFVVLAEVQTPELRAAIPGDYGRSKGVAWYGILRFHQVWGDSGNAGQARGVHVGST